MAKIVKLIEVEGQSPRGFPMLKYYYEDGTWLCDKYDDRDPLAIEMRRIQKEALHDPNEIPTPRDAKED